MYVRILTVKVMKLPATLFCVDEDAPAAMIQRDLDTLYNKEEHKGEIALVDADTPQAAALLACNLDIYYGAIAVRDRSSHFFVVIRSCISSPFPLGHIFKPESVRGPNGKCLDLFNLTLS